MKNAIRVKMLNPDCQVAVLYKDIITYGFREQYYTDARRRGVLFMRYSEERPPMVELVDGKLQVRVVDPSLGERQFTFAPDLLSLSMPIVPSDKTAQLAKTLKLPLSDEGFFLEADLKIRGGEAEQAIGAFAGRLDQHIGENRHRVPLLDDSLNSGEALDEFTFGDREFHRHHLLLRLRVQSER